MFENLGAISPEEKELLRQTHDKLIEDQIGVLNLENITEVLDHIEQMIEENPDLLKTPGARAKIEKVQKRLAELLRQEHGQDTETLH